MTKEKGGLLKRIFSFGFGSRKQAAQEAEEAQAQPQEEPVVDTPPAVETAPVAVETAQVAEPTEPEPSEKPKADRKKQQKAKPKPTPKPKPAPKPRPVAQVQPDPEPAPEPVPEAPIEEAPREIEPEPPAAAEPKDSSDGEQQRRTGWFQRMRKGLARSSTALVDNVASVFKTRRLDETVLQDLEDVLIQADLGVETALNITESLASQRMGKDVTDQEIRQIMAQEITKVLEPVAQPLEIDLAVKPHVILMIGVNGSGKTTTIGKLAAKLGRAGYSTLLVAGDTFRAAAIEQLKIWGERTESPVIARDLGADAAGLAFDAYAHARDAGHDVMLMDTAGRLQNKTELMAELEKIIRVLRKQDPTAPHTVLLTLDATTGQNALNQVEIFTATAGVNGLVMTKLDGTARGGILVAIASKHALPVYFIGVGEQVDDLEPFEAEEFARSIVGLEPENSLVD